MVRTPYPSSRCINSWLNVSDPRRAYLQPPIHSDQRKFYQSFHQRTSISRRFRTDCSCLPSRLRAWAQAAGIERLQAHGMEVYALTMDEIQLEKAQPAAIEYVEVK